MQYQHRKETECLDRRWRYCVLCGQSYAQQEIFYTNATWAPAVGEVLTGTTSGKSATVAEAHPLNAGNGMVVVAGSTGEFIDGEPMTGNGATQALTDGGFELWNNSSILTDWTQLPFSFPNDSVNRESSDKVAGSYSVRIDIGDPNQPGNYSEISQSITLLPGKSYALTVHYKSAALVPVLTLEASTTSDRLQADGVTWNKSSYIYLPASTTWATFALSFTAHPTETQYQLTFQSPVGASGPNSIYLDSASILRVYSATCHYYAEKRYGISYPETDLVLFEGKEYCRAHFAAMTNKIADRYVPDIKEL